MTDKSVGCGAGMRQLCRRNFSFFEKANKNWETAWVQKLTPWDTGQVSRPLECEFQSKSLVIPKRKHERDERGERGEKREKREEENDILSRALVPGCGSGYDCKFLGEIGLVSYFFSHSLQRI